MSRLISWLFPITLFAFVAGSIQYLSYFFGEKARWGFVVVLACYAILKFPRGHWNRLPVLTLFLYSAWCVTTTYWSEVFELSFAKSLSFVMVVFAFVLGGNVWTLRQSGNSLDYLAPTALVALAAAGLGFFFSPFAYDGYLFQGFVYGANMLGSLLAMVLPWFLWRANSNFHDKRRLSFWATASGLVILFVLMSQSRSALLMVLFTIGGLLMALSRRKLALYMYGVTLLLILLAWFRPATIESAVKQTVYKHGDRVFYTREQTWADSWEAAQKGGWTGAGYGVSIGEQSWAGGFSSGGYGREKGSSQLAIMEETGAVGLGFYCLLLFAVARRIFKAFKLAATPELRVSLGLVLGTWMGMHLQSVFEGWWVAPGSPESAAFWALTGVALGMSAQSDRQSKTIRHPEAVLEARHV